MPESLVTALGRLGHQVESVNRLGIKGIADEPLYRDLAQTYDLCFTRDAGRCSIVASLSERAYKEHGYRLQEIVAHLGAHCATVSRYLKRTEERSGRA